MADDDRIELAAVLDGVRATVQAAASADPNPSDPYRGLYVSDELALRLGADGPPLRLEERFELVCERRWPPTSTSTSSPSPVEDEGGEQP